MNGDERFMGIWRPSGVRHAGIRISVTVKIGVVFVLLSLVFGGVLLLNFWLEEQLRRQPKPARLQTRAFDVPSFLGYLYGL
ncbi:MAG: hypothetical protein C4294_10950 [Nitrospiraceae bacterium]